MYWLFYMIARKIGTLYLIFAAIAGMIGMACIGLEIFGYFFSDIIPTTVHIYLNMFPNDVGVQTEDLVNAVDSLDPINNTSNTVVCHDVGVQTEDLVNTEDNLDPINEDPQHETPVEDQQPIHVDAGAQTSIRSQFSEFKGWLMGLLGLDNSEIVTPTDVKVEEWLENLDSSQSNPSIDDISDETDPNHPLVEVSDLFYDTPIEENNDGSDPSDIFTG
jgi:hypothetical protein